MFPDIVLLLLSLVSLCIFIAHKRRKSRFDDDWRRVPPPNWRCRRGGVDYL